MATVFLHASVMLTAGELETGVGVGSFAMRQEHSQVWPLQGVGGLREAGTWRVGRFIFKYFPQHTPFDGKHGNPGVVDGKGVVQCHSLWQGLRAGSRTGWSLTYP